jgi:hypothetical protein
VIDACPSSICRSAVCSSVTGLLVRVCIIRLVSL